MSSLKSLSSRYYLGFNIPLHLILILSLWFFNINWIYLIVFYTLIYWGGVQAGFHKLFSHKSWEPRNNFVKYSLAVLGCFGLMGGPISWARMHRWHHAHSDTDKDPHSPIKGLYISYFGWLLNPPEVPIFIIKDHLKDQILINIEKRCREIVLVILAIFFFISSDIFVSLLAAMILTFHSEMLVNSFLHRKINEEYSSINNLHFSLLSGGSSLHKNHHDCPSSPNFGNKWYEIDLSYHLIKLIRK